MKYLVYIFFFLVIVGMVNAITINQVYLNDSDNFYSTYAGNNIVHILVNATGASSGNEAVIADFNSLGNYTTNISCNGSDNGTIFLTNSSSSSDIWTGVCNVSSAAGAISSTPYVEEGYILVVANESNGNASVSSSTQIVLYNITTPPITNSCYMLGNSTTDFSSEQNFSDINLVLELKLLPNASCNPMNITLPWTGYQDVILINFSSINFTNLSVISKLSSLTDAIDVYIAPVYSFKPSRIYVNSTAFSQLDTNTSIIFYHLPFTSMPAVEGDNSSENVSNIIWKSNGFDPIINATSGNLTFDVNGFSGYNITDNSSPIISALYPANNSYLNTTNIFFNITANGTGTGISAAYFYLNGTPVANFTNISVNSICMNISSLELYVCNFNYTVAGDGNYSLTSIVYDYGGLYPGNVANSTTFFVVDTLAPSIVSSNLYSEDVNSSIAIVGDTLVLEFNASEQLNTTLSKVIISGNTVNITSVSADMYNATYIIPSGSSQGNITYSLMLVDFAGNSNSTGNITSGVIFDDYPVVTSNLPAVIAGNSTSFSINGTANDTYGLNTTIPIYVNGILNGTADYNSSSAYYTYNIYGLISGLYNISIKFFDINGNMLALNKTLVVDNTSPSVSISSPANNTIQNSIPAFTFSAIDQMVSISSCWYNLSGSATSNVILNNCSNGTNTLTLYLASGNYSIIVSASDAVGNINSSGQINFSVSDSSPPAVTFASPASGTTFNSTVTSVQVNVTTDENATCYWFSNNYPPTGFMPTLGTKFILDNITYHSTSIIVSSGSSATSYTIYVSCVDMSGNFNNLSSSASGLSTQFTISAIPSTSSSSSSSGGGGGGSGGAGTPDPSQSVSFDILPVGASVINAGGSGIPVSSIYLTITSASSNVKFTFTAVSSPYAVYGTNVYKYIEVDHPALDNSLISNAKIMFSVSNSWLSANGISPKSVVLVRYSNNTWTQLSTTQSSSDATNTYYTADSPGLSLFAISVYNVSALQSGTVVSNTTGSNVTGSTNTTTAAVKNETGNATSKQKTSGSSSGSSSMPIIIVVVVVIVFVVGFVIIKRKKDGNSGSMQGGASPPTG